MPAPRAPRNISRGTDAAHPPEPAQRGAGEPGSAPTGVCRDRGRDRSLRSAPGAGRRHRRVSRRARVARRRGSDGLLPIRARGPEAGRRHDPGPGLVLSHRHLLRHQGLRCLGIGQRHARGPGPDRRRRLRPAPARHFRRSAPGLPVRRQPVRNPAGWQPDRRRAGQGEPRRRGERDQPHAGLRLRLPGKTHGLWLRGRDPHPLPEHQLSGCRRAELGHQRHPQGAALGIHRHVDFQQAGRGLVSGPVRPAGGDAGPQPGAWSWI